MPVAGGLAGVFPVRIRKAIVRTSRNRHNFSEKVHYGNLGAMFSRNWNNLMGESQLWEDWVTRRNSIAPHRGRAAIRLGAGPRLVMCGGSRNLRSVRSESTTLPSEPHRMSRETHSRLVSGAAGRDAGGGTAKASPRCASRPFSCSYQAALLLA